MACGGGTGGGLLEPLCLYGRGSHTVGFVAVAVEGVEVDRSPGEIVVSFVAGKGEIVEVGLEIGGEPVVVAGDREEAVDLTASTVTAEVGKDVTVEILSDVGVDSLCAPVGVVVIAQGEDECGVPRLDERGDGFFVRAGESIIADDGEDEGGRNGRGR